MAINSVMIDSREPARIQKLTFGGVPTVVTALDAGDVLVATGDSAMLSIERKTPTDLLGTIKAGRLFPQITRMIDLTPWRYLVIEGDWRRSTHGRVEVRRGAWAQWDETGWQWSAVQGALLTAQEMGVYVIQCGDGQFEDAVIRLAKRSRGEKTVAPPRLPNVLSNGEAIIAGLPGIGMDRMGAVLDHCGTPAWALTWLTDLNSDGIDGVSYGIKRAVRNALGLSDGLLLHVIADGNGEYPITLQFPVETRLGVPDGRWQRLEDGRIEATFNSADELQLAISTGGHNGT